MVASFFFLVFILFAFLAYVAILFLRIVFRLRRARTRGPAGGPGGPPVQGVMVKDDICGTYIPREEALRESRGGADHFFCSEECRRKFRAG